MMYDWYYIAYRTEQRVCKHFVGFCGFNILVAVLSGAQYRLQLAFRKLQNPHKSREMKTGAEDPQLWSNGGRAASVTFRFDQEQRHTGGFWMAGHSRPLQTTNPWPWSLFHLFLQTATQPSAREKKKRGENYQPLGFKLGPKYWYRSQDHLCLPRRNTKQGVEVKVNASTGLRRRTAGPSAPTCPTFPADAPVW